MNVRHVLVIGATVATVTAGTWAGEEKCFVREGDVWVFLGDSITHADTYRRTVDRVLRHFHPDARFTLTQKGVSGALATASKEQFDKAAKEDRPTVVSLMTGMNNSINSSWRFGQPMDEPLDSYRQSMVRFVEGAAEKGLAVVLLSPTLTDESLGWGSMWALEGTAEFLRRCGKLVSQIASEHGAVYIPAGEELEAAQARRAPEQLLRADGVHPSAPGQYEIAGSILRRIAPWAELGSGERKLSAAPPPLAVELKPASRFANDGAAEIALTIRCQAATKVTATWSIGDRRASEHIDLAVGEQTWTLRLPAPLKLQPGDSTDLVLDLTDGTRRGVADRPVPRSRAAPVRGEGLRHDRERQ